MCGYSVCIYDMCHVYTVIFLHVFLYTCIYMQKNIHVYVDRFFKIIPATHAAHANTINIYSYVAGVYAYCGGSTPANKKWRIS